MTIEFLLRRAAARRSARPADGAADARRDGRRRHPRPARRRLPPLRDRRDLARAPLRADALRQRPARPRLPPRLGAHRRRRAIARSRRARSTTCSASSRRPTARSRPARTPTPRARRARRSPGAREEIRDALGDDAALFSTAYGVTDGGNWEGVTILSRIRPTSELATLYGMRRPRSRRGSRARGSGCSRSAPARPQPARDDKALAAWNGLAIGALADAARLLRFTRGRRGPAGDRTGPRRSARRR